MCWLSIKQANSIHATLYLWSLFLLSSFTLVLVAVVAVRLLQFFFVSVPTNLLLFCWYYINYNQFLKTTNIDHVMFEVWILRKENEVRRNKK